MPKPYSEIEPQHVLEEIERISESFKLFAIQIINILAQDQTSPNTSSDLNPELQESLNELPDNLREALQDFLKKNSYTTAETSLANVMSVMQDWSEGKPLTQSIIAGYVKHDNDHVWHRAQKVMNIVDGATENDQTFAMQILKLENELELLFNTYPIFLAYNDNFFVSKLIELRKTLQIAKKAIKKAQIFFLEQVASTSEYTEYNKLQRRKKRIERKSAEKKALYKAYTEISTDSFYMNQLYEVISKNVTTEDNNKVFEFKRTALLMLVIMSNLPTILGVLLKNKAFNRSRHASLVNNIFQEMDSIQKKTTDIINSVRSTSDSRISTINLIFDQVNIHGNIGGFVGAFYGLIDKIHTEDDPIFEDERICNLIEQILSIDLSTLQTLLQKFITVLTVVQPKLKKQIENLSGEYDHISEKATELRKAMYQQFINLESDPSLETDNMINELLKMYQSIFATISYMSRSFNQIK